MLLNATVKRSLGALSYIQLGKRRVPLCQRWWESFDPSLNEIRREYPLRTSWGCKVPAPPSQAPPAAAHAPSAAPGQAPPAAPHATPAHAAPDVNGSFAIGMEDVKRSCAFNLEDVRGFDENPPDIPVIP